MRWEIFKRFVINLFKILYQILSELVKFYRRYDNIRLTFFWDTVYSVLQYRIAIIALTKMKKSNYALMRQVRENLEAMHHECKLAGETVGEKL